jgi:dienelactone hydrolase
MKTETLNYRDGETLCRGIYVYDETKSGRRPGIVVAPDIRGVGLRPRGRTERLAALGYGVLVADVYGNGTNMRDFAHGMELIMGVRKNNSGWRSRIRAAVDTLGAQPQIDKLRLGAIGYCFGGSTVIELALSGTLVNAVVSFHGGLDGLQLQDASNIKARVLVCTGAEDPLVPAAHVVALQEGLRKGGVLDWEVVTYSNTKHSFTDPDIPDAPNTAYNKIADERSFAAMAALFNEAFA